MDKPSRPKSQRKLSSARPNAKRGMAGIPKVSRKSRGNAMGTVPSQEDKRPAFTLTSVQPVTAKVKAKPKLGSLMVLIEEPVRITSKNFHSWSSFSVTLQEYVKYTRQLVDFSGHVCTLYREAYEV